LISKKLVSTVCVAFFGVQGVEFASDCMTEKEILEQYPQLRK